jgi:hypothetical protein
MITPDYAIGWSAVLHYVLARSLHVGRKMARETFSGEHFCPIWEEEIVRYRRSWPLGQENFDNKLNRGCNGNLLLGQNSPNHARGRGEIPLGNLTMRYPALARYTQASSFHFRNQALA